jgi:hypothetical protein
VNVVSFLLARNTCHLINYIPCLLPSLSPHGVDLVDPFKKVKGGFTHIFIVVDKFIKWVKVKLVASITAAKAVEYIDEIIYRFGVPNNIITNNGTQFTVREFKDFCADLGIKINYASVSHSQNNGQVERSNGMILRGLKPRIFDRLKPYAGKWVKGLPSVLWALRTILSHAMGHTPFSLLYGSEAMVPTDERQSDDSRVNDFTRLEELREATVIKLTKHQQAMRHYHAWNMNSRSFPVRDFI